MRKLLGHQVGHRDIEEIIRDVDLNGDGRVDFEGRWDLSVGEKVRRQWPSTEPSRCVSIMQPSVCQLSIPSPLSPCPCPSLPPIPTPVCPSVHPSFHACLSSCSSIHLFICPGLLTHSSTLAQSSIQPLICTLRYPPMHLLTILHASIYPKHLSIHDSLLP